MKLQKLFVIIAMLTSVSAYAQEAKPQEWKANVGLSGVLNTGNSVNQTIAGSALVSYKQDKNQITWNAGGSYGRAKDNATGITSTNSKNWLSQIRYDRFLTEIFSLYGLGHIGQNELAGYDLRYGAAAGYSHFLYKTDATVFKYELGFDVTQENRVTPPDATIYSARTFLQYTHKFSETASFGQDAEGLFNVQEGEDYRINTLTSLNLKLTQKVAFQVGYAIRFDNVPVPSFKKVDTITQLGLNVNFL